MITYSSTPEDLRLVAAAELRRELAGSESPPIANSLSESLAVVAHQEACPKPCVRPPAIDRNDWNKLLEIWTEIGPNARAALVMIGERLRMGRKAYDDDFTDDRDWDQMALEEDLDGCVYRAVKKVKEIRGR